MSGLPSQTRAPRFWSGVSLALLLAVRAHAEPSVTLSASPNPVNETRTFTLTVKITDLEEDTVTHTRYERTAPDSVILYDAAPVVTSLGVTAPEVSAGGLAQKFRVTVTSVDRLGVVSDTTAETEVVINNVLVAPVANAGTNVIVRVLKTGQLNGSGTDSNGTIVSYLWTQTAGTAMALSDPNIPNPTFTAPATTGTHIYRLTVTENDGQSASDSTVVTVKANTKPVVNAGPATQTVTEGTVVTLNGTATDANNDPLTYSWTQISGPQSLVINDPTSLTASFTAPMVTANEVYAIRLSAADDLSVVSDTITITVTSVNHPPVANAGPNQSVTEGAVVTLTGAASTDPDGDALTYAWVQSATPTGQPVVTLVNPNTVSPHFTAPTVTLAGSILRFRVTVTDGKGGSASATVDVQVQNSGVPNRPPVVNAGGDQNVEEKSAVTLKGTASDPDGTAVSITWTKLSGPRNITITNASSLIATFTAPDVDKDELYVFQMSGSDGFFVIQDTMTVLVRANGDPAGASAGLPLIANPKIYPSPFSPAAGGATIGYTLRSNSDVTILISDIFGREVRELRIAAGNLGGTAGDNALPWDGRNGDGDAIGNGAYTVQIRASDGFGSQGKISDRVGIRR